MVSVMEISTPHVTGWSDCFGQPEQQGSAGPAADVKYALSRHWCGGRQCGESHIREEAVNTSLLGHPAPCCVAVPELSLRLPIDAMSLMPDLLGYR